MIECAPYFLIVEPKRYKIREKPRVQRSKKVRVGRYEAGRQSHLFGLRLHHGLHQSLFQITT